MVVRPGPSIEPHLLGIEAILPSQIAPHAPRTAERALLGRLLVDALADAGVLAGGRWRRRPPPTLRMLLARRWLLGELNAHVALPVQLVCDALGLGAGVLAATVRAGATPLPPIFPDWRLGLSPLRRKPAPAAGFGAGPRT
jgi:hypothetical protein